MPEIALTGVLVVAAVAFAVPLLLGLAPALRLLAVVLEIVAGVVIGLSVLGAVEVDAPLQVLALIGLAFLLFLAGLEIDPEGLRGGQLGLAASGFALCPHWRSGPGARRTDGAAGSVILSLQGPLASRGIPSSPSTPTSQTCRS